MLKRNICNLLVVLLFQSIVFAQIQRAVEPNWIDNITYEKQPNIDDDDISYGLLTLLSDAQTHIPRQQNYRRIVQKITDNVGIQEASLISINFDPAYQKLILHKVEIIRNDKTINKLNVSDFQLIRKESNSENYIYDGSLNATANLSDVRNGDIIDFSYSIVGFNPLNKKFSSATTLDDYVPVGKIHVNYLSKNKLTYKLLNANTEPTVSNKMGLTSYKWLVSNTKSVALEDNVPSWHMQFQNLFVSEYNNWGEVVDWALPIYQTNPKLSNGLSQKINAIISASEFEADRITSALKFVQNDIRYLGLESGIGAYKPFKPNRVFEQRFGDCKDKTWLLVNMLREMQIEAYPVLVNTTHGKVLPELLPTPNMFDHVIVKVIDSTKASFFYDPTNSNQGGVHGKIAMPNFGNGLVIKKGNTTLEPITIEQKDLVEIFDTFTIEELNKDMTLDVTSVYREGEADVMRSVLKSSSITSLNKDYRDYYKNFYDEVEILKAMTFEDDTVANKITIEESYRFNNIWKPMVGDESKIAVAFTPYSLYNILTFPDEKYRTTPFSLYYPIHKKHNITVKLPMSWGLENDYLNVESEHFDFSFKCTSNKRKDIVYFNYEYENKSSYVPVEDFDTFFDDYKKVENIMSYYLYIPKSSAKISNLFNTNDKSNSSSSDTNSLKDLGSSIGKILLVFLILIVVVAIFLVIYVIRSNRNRD